LNSFKFYRNEQESSLYYEQEKIWADRAFSETGSAPAEAGGLTRETGVNGMPRLYRSAKDFHHWFVYEDVVGWVRFPAKINGWAERRPVQGLQMLDLREAPLWLSFNTGLLDAGHSRRLSVAA